MTRRWLAALLALSPAVALAQSAGTIAIPPDTTITARLGTAASAPVRVVGASGGLPEIHGIVVVDDQLSGPGLSAGWQESDGNLRYPFPKNDNDLLERGGRPRATRTLFVWGRRLPRVAGDVQVVALSPHLHYRADVGSSLAGITGRAWAKIAKSDPVAARQRATFDTLVLYATLLEGVTPGSQGLLVNGARGAWPLMFRDQIAALGFTRVAGDGPFEPTDALFERDIAYVELVYGSNLPVDDVGVELRVRRAGRTREDSLGVLPAHRVAPVGPPGQTTAVRLRTDAFRIAGRAAAAPGADGDPLPVALGSGDRLTAVLVDRFQALTVPPVAEASIFANPTGLGLSWRIALERVAACYGEPPTAVGPRYALEQASRLSPLLIGPAGVAIAKALAVHALPLGPLFFDTARARREVLTEASGDRNAVVLRKGDHAAAILIRDEFVRLAQAALNGAQSPGDRSAIDRVTVGAAIARAGAAGDCSLDELLVLAGQDAPRVVANVVRRLVRWDGGGTPPRWVPDRPAQAFVKGLHTTGAAVRALNELSSIDDAYKALALAAATAGVAAGAELAGLGTAAAYTLIAGDVADIAIFGSKSVVDYYAGEKQYQFATGATPFLGSEAFLSEAEDSRQSALMTAVGVIAPAVSAGVGLRSLRAIQRGRAALRAAEGGLDDLNRLTEAQRADLAAYYVNLKGRAGDALASLDEVDAAALKQFDQYFARAGVPGTPTAALPAPDVPASTPAPPSSIPSTPRRMLGGASDDLAIQLDSSDLRHLEGGGPGLGSALPPSELAPPSLLSPPPSPLLSLDATGPAGDRATIEALHADRIARNETLQAADAARFRDTATHLAPQYAHAVETLALDGEAFRIDGRVLRRGRLLNPVPADPNAPSNGAFADVYEVIDESGTSAPFVIKIYGERTPWEADAATGVRSRRPSLNSSSADDIEMADDIEYGAGLLARIGVAQADLVHVEHRGPHPVILQRRLGADLPPGVIGEESWDAAAARLKVPQSAGWRLRPEFASHRMAVLEMRRRMADAGVGWEDGHPGNFFFQEVRHPDGSTGVRAAIADQDRMDYVTHFGDGRQPRGGRISSAALDHVYRRWRTEAPAPLRRLLGRDDPHALAIASLWHKGAFRFDAAGRPLDGWLKVDEIRAVFGDHFRQLVDTIGTPRRPPVAVFEPWRVRVPPPLRRPTLETRWTFCLAA